jgi:hypothetical protein
MGPIRRRVVVLNPRYSWRRPCVKPGLIYNDCVMMIRFSSVFLLSL